MPTEFYESPELNHIVTDLLRDVSLHELGPLRDSQCRILPRMKRKQDSEDVVVKCGKPVDVKKVSDLHKSCGLDTDYLLVVDQQAWDVRDEDRAKQALLHSALMGIEAEKDAKGKWTFKKRDFEIQEHIETVNRFGNYNPGLSEVLALLTASEKAARADKPKVTSAKV